MMGFLSLRGQFAFNYQLGWFQTNFTLLPIETLRFAYGYNIKYEYNFRILNNMYMLMCQ